MTDIPADFEAFMREREAASVAFVNGDFGPLDAVSAQVSPATIFGPRGDCVQDADKVNAANANGARMFTSGSTSSFEPMQMAAGDSLAFWSGIQRSMVRMQGAPEPVRMDLRVTEVFRRDGATWKLVHRHADALKDGTG